MYNKSFKGKYISQVLEYLERSNAVTDWVGTVELFITNNGYDPKVDAAGMLEIIDMMRPLIKNVALLNYLDSYCLAFKRKGMRPSFLIPISKYLSRFEKKPLAVDQLMELVRETEKPGVILALAPQYLSASRYLYNIDRGYAIKRRESLVFLMSEALIKGLNGGAGSAERACNLAASLIKLINNSSLKGQTYKREITIWREDVAYLKYNYFDCVLHTKGLVWPNG